MIISLFAPDNENRNIWGKTGYEMRKKLVFAAIMVVIALALTACVGIGGGTEQNPGSQSIVDSSPERNLALEPVM